MFIVLSHDMSDSAN